MCKTEKIIRENTRNITISKKSNANRNSDPEIMEENTGNITSETNKKGCERSVRREMKGKGRGKERKRENEAENNEEKAENIQRK